MQVLRPTPRHRARARATRARRFLPVVALTALALLAPRSAPPAEALGWSPEVDAPSGYDGQTTCVRTPAPGTVALARYLLRTYRATRSMGTLRACGRGGRSEHKDGRAFDWGADVARPATRRAAYDFLRKALATDAAGNEHALARRMGIMYLIYADTIWSSYRDFAPRPYLSSGCRTKKKCSRSLRHLDHVHISLGLAGAAAQTSWYRARNVPTRPVLYPGTRLLDPDLTAVTGFAVPATGALTTSPFVLKAGITYRVVATGTASFAGGTGDAQCTRATGAAAAEPTPRGPVLGLPGQRTGWGWDEPSAGSDHPASPYALPLPTTRGLLLQGGLRWEGSCRADHTYEAWLTPVVDQRLQLRYVGLPTSANRGGFTVYVARDDIALASLSR